MEPVVIGVAGGTGSGKTTVAHEILKRAGTKQISLIQHDSRHRWSLRRGRGKSCLHFENHLPQWGLQRGM